MNIKRKRFVCVYFSVLIAVVMMSVISVWANHKLGKGPSEHNGIKFIDQNMDQAVKECDHGGKPLPEFVPTVRDGEPNLALMVGAKAAFSDEVANGDWCPTPHNPKGKDKGRHCGVYINDGFYNNCRSWIGGKYPGWVQVDLGKLANINRIFIGSDHSQGFSDRAVTQFDVLVSTNAASWKKAFSYDNKEKPVRGTTEFRFSDVTARYVRIHVIGSSGSRIDELEIYGGKDPLGSLISFSSVSEVRVGDQFTVDVLVEDVVDLAGWQTDLLFDSDILEFKQVEEGNFLKQGGGQTFWQPGKSDMKRGTVSGINAAFLGQGRVSGTGKLLTITFKAKLAGVSVLNLGNLHLGDPSGEIIQHHAATGKVTIIDFPAWDVNKDGSVNIFDLILVAQNFGQQSLSNPRVDVKKDGVVNIFDLILVAQHFGETTDIAAPLMLAKELDFTTQQKLSIQSAIVELQGLPVRSQAEELVLNLLKTILPEQLPEQTQLLPNYPNPFNPETWIPFELNQDSEVSITIYDVAGTAVRSISVGYLQAGRYVSQSRAIYWDGRTQSGEQVASGTYFYTLKTKGYVSTQKMIILK